MPDRANRSGLRPPTCLPPLPDSTDARERRAPSASSLLKLAEILQAAGQPVDRRQDTGAQGLEVDLAPGQGRRNGSKRRAQAESLQCISARIVSVPYIRTHPGSAPTVKQQHWPPSGVLCDWLVIHKVLPVNPAAAVRGPKHVVTKGATPVLTPAETRSLLDGIDPGSLVGLRDRALLSVMVYSFARVSAVVGMRRRDYFLQGTRGWLRLHEKGGKRHDVPAHHRAEAAVDAYLVAGGIEDAKAPLFQSVDRSHRLSGRSLTRRVVLAMIKRRSAPRVCRRRRAATRSVRRASRRICRTGDARARRPARTPQAFVRLEMATSVASSQIYSVSVLAPAADRLRGAVRQAKGGVLGAAELYRVAESADYAMHLRDSTLEKGPLWPREKGPPDEVGRGNRSRLRTGRPPPRQLRQYVSPTPRPRSLGGKAPQTPPRM